MKTLIVAASLWLTLNPLLAHPLQPADIPAPVLDQFLLLYPEARQVVWTSQEGLFAVRFKNQGHKTVVILDDEGAVKRIEANIRVTALPKKASAYLLEEVNARRIRQATIIAPESGEILFEADIAPGTAYVFDSDGDLIGRKEQ